jgi:hypothetical protein
MSLSNHRLNKMPFTFIMISLICFIFAFAGSSSLPLINSITSAQIVNPNLIQITSTSTYTDDQGNFHIIGEVNNTSIQPQTNIIVTALLSDTTNNNNVIVGNHSAFTSIETLRTDELSPFDIVIQDSQQILDKFNFIEFSTTSKPTIAEKPATLFINGSNSFVDNVGNPHITGSIINQGQSSEQFLNLVATFYDKSSLGVVGTQSFGLNVENLAYNQMAPFDITITDNKTISQGAFYSLNVESIQSSMSPPLNPKISFVSSAEFGGGGGGGSEVGLANSSPVNNQPVFTNNNNDDDSRSDDNGDENDNGDNQRGEKKTDDEGNPWFDDKNCSEESGSSGGSSSECEEAEKEEESEREDEDSLEKDQGPPSNSNSNSDSTNDDNESGNENNGDKNNEDDNDDGDNSSNDNTIDDSSN